MKDFTPSSLCGIVAVLLYSTGCDGPLRPGCHSELAFW